MSFNKFLYFIGDAFSKELLIHLNKLKNVNLIPISTLETFSEKNIAGFIYTPSVGFKERSILQLLPSEIKKIAILDLFHFDFKDFLVSFKEFQPDIILSPITIKEFMTITIPIKSFIQEIYSQQEMLTDKNSNIKDICFISQPLLEERACNHNQHDLIRSLHQCLAKVNPNIVLYIKTHPRENLALHTTGKVLNLSIQEILTSFDQFAGINSALLYAADGLGKKTLKLSAVEEINEASLYKFLAQPPKKNSITKNEESPLKALNELLLKT